MQRTISTRSPYWAWLGLCAGLEAEQGEEEAGQKEEEGRTRRSGPGRKEDMAGLCGGSCFASYYVHVP
jgi:hypothetical protein